MGRPSAGPSSMTVPWSPLPLWDLLLYQWPTYWQFVHRAVHKILHKNLCNLLCLPSLMPAALKAVFSSTRQD